MYTFLISLLVLKFQIESAALPYINGISYLVGDTTMSCTYVPYKFPVINFLLSKLYRVLYEWPKHVFNEGEEMREQKILADIFLQTSSTSYSINFKCYSLMGDCLFRGLFADHRKLRLRCRQFISIDLSRCLYKLFAPPNTIQSPCIMEVGVPRVSFGRDRQWFSP